MPKFECHYCTQHIDADDSLRGQGVDCPTCGTPLTVPPPAATNVQESPKLARPHVPDDALGKMRNYAGAAALGALGISAVCVTIPYASAGARGMALFTSDALIGQSLGRGLVYVAVGAAVSAVVAGVAYALKKPFALNFFRAFIWAVLATSLLGLFASIREGAAIAQRVRELDQKQSASKKVLSAAMLEIEAAAVEAFPPTPAGTPSPSPTKTKSHSVDAAAEVQAMGSLIKEFSQDMVRARNDYEQATDEVGIERLLDSTRIVADKNFTDTLAILMKLRSAADANRRRVEDLMSSFPERLDKFNFSPSTRDDLLTGFRKQFQKNAPQMRENLDLEDKVVELFEKIIDHLIATKERWSSVGGTFTFEAEQDLEAFSNFVEEIQDCAARQEEIQKEAEGETAKQIEAMRKLLRQD